jgi:hypothetical protein
MKTSILKQRNGRQGTAVGLQWNELEVGDRLSTLGRAVTHAVFALDVVAVRMVEEMFTRSKTSKRCR